MTHRQRNASGQYRVPVVGGEPIGAFVPDPVPLQPAMHFPGSDSASGNRPLKVIALVEAPGPAGAATEPHRRIHAGEDIQTKRVEINPD